MFAVLFECVNMLTFSNLYDTKQPAAEADRSVFSLAGLFGHRPKFWKKTIWT